MSNIEHLFENAIVALENKYYFGEWKRIEKDRHNTDGVSEEILEVVWVLAIYTKYTYEPSLNAIPIEWIEKWFSQFYGEQGLEWNRCKRFMLEDWGRENGKDSE